MVAEGQSDQALTYLRRAARREAAEPDEGVAVPALEMLADLLLEMKRPAESLQTYQSVVKAAPNRFNALLGAASAADALGKTGLARDYDRQLIALAAPNADRPEVEAARAYLSER